jgi:geranylgeranyl reductase family protein
MQTGYDVIVVGAGPAGACCALFAARAGLRVLLTDRARFPRDKVCGDCVPQRALVCLEELGLLDRLEAVPHASLTHFRLVAPGGAAALVPFRPAGVEPPGYRAWVCRRRELDALLVAEARACVELREGFAVDEVWRDGPAVTGVCGHGPGGRREHLAGRVVVGADGPMSAVRRSLGLNQADPRHRALALRAYFDGVAIDGTVAEVHFLRGASPGYLWLFPAGSGLTNVGLGMRQLEFRRDGRSLRHLLAESVRQHPLAERFAAARQEGPALGWPLPLGSRRGPVHGDGFLLAGDAAGLVNPFSGEGIGNAMWSGRLAAQVAAEACAAGDVSARGLAPYASRLWAALGGELALCAQLQRLGRHGSLLDLVLGRAARRREVADWLGMMLCGRVSKAVLRSPWTYLRLLAK